MGVIGMGRRKWDGVGVCMELGMEIGQGCGGNWGEVGCRWEWDGNEDVDGVGMECGMR